MIIGLLSDTHGNVSRTRTALEALSAAGAEHLIHCGDLGGEDVLTLLFEKQQEGVPVTAVAGNVDEWNPDLILYAKRHSDPFSGGTRLGPAFAAGPIPELRGETGKTDPIYFP